MTGFHGQKFDFTGDDGGWDAHISYPRPMQIHVRTTAPFLFFPVIACIAGRSLVNTDANGSDHTAVISVKEPQSLDSACYANEHPGLEDNSLNVVIDGEEALGASGTVSVAPGYASRHREHAWGVPVLGVGDVLGET